jgi:hypothetical protein
MWNQPDPSIVSLAGPSIPSSTLLYILGAEQRLVKLVDQVLRALLAAWVYPLSGRHSPTSPKIKYRKGQDLGLIAGIIKC